MLTNDPTYTVYERKPKKKQKHNKTINIIFIYGKYNYSKQDKGRHERDGELLGR
jgi:hypothetical protein